MEFKIENLSEQFYREYKKAKNKADAFLKKDWRNDGIINILFCFIVILSVSAIVIHFIGDKIPLNIKVYGNMIWCFIGILITLFLCIRDKVHFCNAEEIVKIFEYLYKEKMYEIKLQAINEAQSKIKIKNNMVESLKGEYEIKKKSYDEDDLKKRIAYAKEEITKKEKELEDITYKTVLSDKSYNIRITTNRIFDTFLKSSITFIFSFMILSLPCMMTTEKYQNGDFIQIIFLISLIPAILIAMAYTWSKKQDLKAFHILNTCELPDKPTDFEYYDLEYKMKNVKEIYSDFLEIAYSFFEQVI